MGYTISLLKKQSGSYSVLLIEIYQSYEVANMHNFKISVKSFIPKIL
jgi:hypothetical protein